GPDPAGSRHRRGRDLPGANDPDAALGARSVGVRPARARLWYRRNCRRTVGYPSNARCPHRRGRVCRPRGVICVRGQPGVQGTTTDAGGDPRTTGNGRKPLEWQAMSSRLAMLEARRRTLMHKCEEQRLELAYRFAQIKPREQLTAWTRRSAAAPGKSPLTWLAGLVGLLLMLRRRRMLSGVGWITGLVAIASRATTLLRILAQLRAVYRSLKATRRP